MSYYGQSLWDEVLEFGGIILGFIAVICLLAAAIILPSRSIGHHAGVGICHQEAQAFQRPTKLVDYNWFSLDCYVQLKNGAWVKDSQYRGVAQ